MCYTTAGGSRHHITCAPQLEPVSGCELEREREGESEGEEESSLRRSQRVRRTPRKSFPCMSMPDAAMSIGHP